MFVLSVRIRKMFPKNNRVIDKKRLENAKHCKVCQSCNNHSDTIVAAHYQGPYQQQLGKGMGQKPDDIHTCYICQECHDAFDGRSPRFSELSTVEKGLLFMVAIQKTNKWIAQNG